MEFPSQSTRQRQEEWNNTTPSLPEHNMIKEAFGMVHELDWKLEQRILHTWEHHKDWCVYCPVGVGAVHAMDGTGGIHIYDPLTGMWGEVWDSSFKNDGYY